jgi:hypothetical protein
VGGKMKMHELKTENPWFTDMWNGEKKFEVRKDDRGFQKDDILWLREFEPNALHGDNEEYLVLLSGNPYSGRELICHVDYILPAGSLPDLNYCVMGITILQKRGEQG